MGAVADPNFKSHSPNPADILSRYLNLIRYLDIFYMPLLYQFKRSKQRLFCNTAMQMVCRDSLLCLFDWRW